MAEPIERIQMGEEVGAVSEAGLSRPKFTGNLFEDVLSKAIEALDKVSNSEFYADQLMEKYMAGEVGMQEVLIAASKMNIMVQLAVTTITTAVNTFKEITQIQV